jgi:quaternary ammonium compound-resistance protein SugE
LIFSGKEAPLNSSWLILIIAGFLETAWAIGLKYTEGFTRLVPSLFTTGAIVASMYLLSRATQNIPIGTAYAVWVGIGALGTAILGVLLLQEPVSWSRLFFMGLLVVAIVGLKFSTAADALAK